MNYPLLLETQVGAWAESLIPAQRIAHVRGVVTTGARLAERYAPGEVSRVRLAGWIHDVAKNWPDARLLAGEVYPAIVEAAGETVDGLVYRGLDGRQLARLDRFEGEMYRRVRVAVLVGDAALQAQVYVLEPFMVKLTPILKAMLPLGLYDRLSHLFGADTSMAQWTGHGPGGEQPDASKDAGTSAAPGGDQAEAGEDQHARRDRRQRRLRCARAVGEGWFDADTPVQPRHEPGQEDGEEHEAHGDEPHARDRPCPEAEPAGPGRHRVSSSRRGWCAARADRYPRCGRKRQRWPPMRRKPRQSPQSRKPSRPPCRPAAIRASVSPPRIARV